MDNQKSSIKRESTPSNLGVVGDSLGYRKQQNEREWGVGPTWNPVSHEDCQPLSVNFSGPIVRKPEGIEKLMVMGEITTNGKRPLRDAYTSTRWTDIVRKKTGL